MKRFLIFLLPVAALLAPRPVAAQITPDQAAEMLLSSARKAFNERNHPFAVNKFREFLGKFGGHKDAPAARFGLALCLIEGPEKNYNEARDLLQQVVGVKDFADHDRAVYQLALALRGQGTQSLQLALAKSGDVAAHRNNAKARFEETEKQLLVARAAFEKKLPAEAPDKKELPPEFEWVARVRCDQAENYLRLNKTKEARDAVAVFLDDPIFSRSKIKGEGRYYLGFASHLLKDYPTAEKALSRLAPFDDPAFGPHAHYLLGRTHHLAEERGEAAHHYEAVLTDHAKRRDEASKLLKEPARFKNDPVIRAQLEAFLKETPDYLARASFYLGVLQYEAGRFAEAQARFVDFQKTFLFSPLRSEAELRLGFCLYQIKNFPEAVKTLSPLVDRDPRLADQALLWIGRCQVAGAPDPVAQKDNYQKAMSQALSTFRQAADRAQKIIDADPEARLRKGQIMLEIADTQQLLKQHREAAGAYGQILNEKLLPDRVEETWERMIQALHLAGDFNESDNQATKFLAAFPKSPLAPEVGFLQAENSYFRGLAAEKNPNPAERTKEVARWNDEAIKRLEGVIERFPEFPKINVARYTLGLTYHRKGDFEKAQQALDAIPQAERGGDLNLTSYLLADCALRLTPAEAPLDDALAVGKMEESLKNAATHLEAFTAGPINPQTGDALLKLGLVQQRLAGLLNQPAEKAKVLATARATYERLFAKEFTGQPAVPQAVLERAKVIGQTDVGQAINELRKFQNDPLKQSATAPIALVQLATYLRGQNKAGEAADVLAKARAEHEDKLQKDPERQPWVAILRYHHGVALREAGKLAEARNAFDSVVKQFPGRVEAAESALRFGQCLKEEGERELDMSVKLRSGAKKAEDFATATKLEADGYKNLRDSVAYLESQAEGIKAAMGKAEVRGRMLYEAAWSMRNLAEPEIAAARKAKKEEILKKLGAMAEKAPLPPITLDQIPLQPSEKKAMDLYRRLINDFGDLALALEGRFELAELMAQRNDQDGALKLLGEALDKEPGQELTEKIRLRLGTLHAAKGNLKGALAQFDAVAANPKSNLIGWAHYHAGESLLKNNQYPEAVKRLVIFRDNGALHNVPGLSDRAFLRLGHAFAFVRDWEASRQAHERVVNAFPSSPWVDEARYGVGFALQNQNRFDEAVNAYTQVTTRSAAEIAAKAQLQIGLCRLEQKRFGDAATAFLVVPFTYDYPDLSAAALLEAARALSDDRKTEQAIRILERVRRDYADTPWAEAALERLKTLRK
ncbi:MAG: tetratricopeptide repeat protein [Gemmataceae bacterium]